MEQETQPVAESAAAGTTTAGAAATGGPERKNEDREPARPQLSLLKLHNNAHEAPPRLVRDRSTEMRSLFPPRPSLMPPQLDRYRSDSSLMLSQPPQLDRFRSDSSMMPPQLERYRSDSSPVEPRMSVCSTSGMVYESVVVVGHMFGNDNVVYYLLEVRSWEMPLEGYVIRRRYSDFKKFHQELSKFMPGNKPRSSSLGFEYAFSSLLCNPLSNTQPEINSQWSPKRSSEGDSSTRRNTRGSSGDDLDPLASPTDQVPLQYEDEARSSITSTPAGWVGPESPLQQTATLEYSVPSTAKPGMTYYDSNLTLPLDSVKFNMSERAILPDMPTGGISSIFSTRQMLIKYRVEQFNKILAAVMSDNSNDVANVLMNFIQEKPGGQVTSYTSLSEYAAIDMPWKVERYARRRAMSMGRRPPTLFRDSSSSSTTSPPKLLRDSSSSSTTSTSAVGITVTVAAAQSSAA